MPVKDISLLTLPNNLTLLPNSFCVGPTSCKFLGILLILSLYKTTWQVVDFSFVESEI